MNDTKLTIKLKDLLAILAKYEHFLSNPVSAIKKEVEKMSK